MIIHDNIKTILKGKPHKYVDIPKCEACEAEDEKGQYVLHFEVDGTSHELEVCVNCYFNYQLEEAEDGGYTSEPLNNEIRKITDKQTDKE